MYDVCDVGLWVASRSELVVVSTGGRRRGKCDVAANTKLSV